jgi:alkanesulfonate monooxygenase SsuD/methylene tetrahydromethanopterin reductase-like flavin-dependent oxidoreductase (luciferase family)
MTSTVDRISGGRLIIGLGVGDNLSIHELQSFGYKFPPLEDRITLLRETVMTLKALWSGNEVSFSGRLVKVHKALCLPKPKQQPGPPIWVGGRHRRILDVVVELADGWNYWDLTKQSLAEREEYLLKKCKQLHKNPDTITESWAGHLSMVPLNGLSLAESMRAELLLQDRRMTHYFIATLPAKAERNAYEGFADAVRSIA